MTTNQNIFVLSHVATVKGPHIETDHVNGFTPEDSVTDCRLVSIDPQNIQALSGVHDGRAGPFLAKQKLYVNGTPDPIVPILWPGYPGQPTLLVLTEHNRSDMIRFREERDQAAIRDTYVDAAAITDIKGTRSGKRCNIKLSGGWDVPVGFSEDHVRQALSNYMSKREKSFRPVWNILRNKPKDPGGP
jgi:hypothetical protein